MIASKLDSIKGLKKFKTLEELQNYYKKNNIEDYFILTDSLYYMSEYDLEGKYIVFTSIEADADIYFNNDNRYKTKNDLEVVLYEGILSLRNDITHYYYNNINNNLKNMFV